MDKPELDSLNCQVAGCNARWTVNAGWKKCSKHAWMEDNPYEQVLKPKFTQPPVNYFYEVDDHDTL
jgi:hypothetical protein